ncbi:MAG: glucosylceramidase [Clostridia bacterium]|nr:glucosylceramidase [Clostridia bacterium]
MKQYLTLFKDGVRESVTRAIAADPKETDREKDLVNLYPEVTYQTVEGFGGAFTDAAGYVYSLMPEALRRSFIDGYFGPDGLGYTVGRTSVDSCDFSREMYAADDVPGDTALTRFDTSRPFKYVMPLFEAARAAAGRDLVMMMTPWSPPAWMKTNSSRVGGGALRPEYRAVWAEYICRYILEARKKGMKAELLSVQNEPKAVQTWDSCLFNAREEAAFVRDHLCPALKKHGLDDIAVLIWDHNKERAYERACEAMADPETEKLIGGVAVHWYSGDHFEALQMIRDRFPDKRIVFSEACVEYSLYREDNQLRNAEMYAHEIIGSLDHGMNIFLDWNLLLDEKGGPNHVGNYCDAPVMYDTRTGELRRNLSYDYIGHFSRYIRPGARRIGLSRFTDRLEATAAVNTDGSVTAVVLNRSGEDIPFFLRMGGRVWPVLQPGGSIGTYVFPAGGDR